MFFKYHPGERFEEGRPKTVYARVDRIEPGDAATEEPATVYLDCVNAQWLDEERNRGQRLSEMEGEEADNHLSIIEAKGGRFNIYSDQRESEDKGEHEGEWWHLTLGEATEGEPVQQYFNLFSDPTERGVITARKLEPHEAALVEQAASWDGITASTPGELDQALRQIEDPDGVAVYDVGQGSCCALLKDGKPILYFDFGGSAIGNWRSFPLHLNRFCFTGNPLIVLSHWDWDHWSSALRDPQALRVTWILPKQSGAGSLGAVHARFLAMLRRHGAGLLWCDPGTAIASRSIEIRSCKGAPTSRNESGLALGLGHFPIQVLLPGDASARNAVYCDCAINHLVVPHHGGRSSLSPLPAPANAASSHLIYSYGVGNIFLHPLTGMRREIRKSWKKHVHTALRNESGFGHVGIDLTGRYKHSPVTPCGGTHCQLAITQWI